MCLMAHAVDATCSSRPVLVTDAADRENEGDVVFPRGQDHHRVDCMDRPRYHWTARCSDARDQG